MPVFIDQTVTGETPKKGNVEHVDVNRISYMFIVLTVLYHGQQMSHPFIRKKSENPGFSGQ
jgi:hypothetical protein